MPWKYPFESTTRSSPSQVLKVRSAVKRPTGLTHCLLPVWDFAVRVDYMYLNYIWLTKRGSSYLRRSAFLAANVARRYAPQFKALYDKKRAEGKTYKEANCAVARKLLKVIRSVWLNGKDYEVPESFSLT
jgi:hypothetical protein